MRIRAFFLFGALLLIPVVVGAVGESTSYKDGSVKCPADKELPATKLEDIKGPIKSSNDRCVHESIKLDAEQGTFTITPTGSTRRAGEDACKVDSCPTTRCGDVTFYVDVKKSCTISKCDPNYEKKISSCLRTPIDLSDRATAREQVGNLDLTTSADREALAQALQEMGVSDITSADVNENPDLAKDLALKIIDGDREGARAAAGELGLNEDLRDVKYLQPDEDNERINYERTDDWTYLGDVTLGAAPVGEAGQVCDELCRAAQVIRYMESGGRYGIRTCTNVCVYGAYQVRGDNIWRWTCEIGQCATPEQFLRNPALQDAVFRHKFGQYVNQFGSHTAAAQAWFGGPGSVGKYGRADAFGTTVGSYAAQFARLFGDPNFNYDAKDYAIRGGGSPFANANPFASGASAGYGPSGGGVPTSGVPSSGAGYPAIAPQSAQQPQSQYVYNPATGQYELRPVSHIAPTPLATSSAAEQLREALRRASQAAEVAPAALIVVQPKEVLRGNPLVVSWSSVGVRAQDPCRVYVESGGANALFARSNEGSRTLVVSATSTPGTWKFTLQCSATGGTLLESSASVLVK
ncbi:hypothetical protein HYW60_00765 [Candidatus Kaiserbacteria bacterium]|nr:hypothetical protein [Candidatus Kaiserbacteria bacterium]